jgi:hypothetical protein
MIEPFAHGCRSEVDKVDDPGWLHTVAQFCDASLYQVWQYGSHPKLFCGTSRLLLIRDAALIAAAELRLYTVPSTRVGIAYVRWGPLWKRRSCAVHSEHLRHAIRALRYEYVVQRGMVLRLNPRLFLEDDQACLLALSEEGFEPFGPQGAEKTLLMEISPALDALRAGFDKKWRNCLSKAERSGLALESGTDARLFDEFEVVYREMLRRKQFEPTASVGKHRSLQQRLPASLKMRIVVARHDGHVCAGAIYSAIGETAYYLFGATNDVGLRTCAAYLVQWEILQQLKRAHVVEYDLHGINAITNPGTYHFKKGFAGRFGREVTFAGQRQAVAPSLATASVLLIERLKSGLLRQRGLQQAVLDNAAAREAVASE